MEGMQYIQHRVIDGTYTAVIYWRIREGIVSYKDLSGHWVETDIPVRFHADLIPELAPSQPLANRKDVK